ncbi:MAG: hypothetical protein IJS38_03240 [Erysipelotrichaceae bacterium]|nr:hypothetical protein [Erysipelotrichaceae bacterium]
MDYSQKQYNDEMEIDLLELFSVLWSKIWLILIVVVLGAVIAGVYTKFMITPQYQSSTSIYVLNRQNESTVTSSDLTASTQLTNDYVELIKTRTVAENVINQLHLDMKPKELLSKLSVSIASNARIIYIRVLDEDPQQARTLANAIRLAASRQIQVVTNSEAVNVVDEANLPDTKYSPSTSRNCIIGGLLGGVVIVAYILLTHFLNDTIRTAEDVEKYLGMSTLGTIPILKGEDAPVKKQRRPLFRKKIGG